MTTSGISKAIARLETDHRIRLFHRSPHALCITEEGASLLAEARDLLGASGRIGLLLAQSANNGNRGRVRISAPPGLTRACLVPILPGFLQQHPDIHIEIDTGYSLVDLAGTGIDIALRTGTLADTPGHISQKLLSSPWCAYATPDYLARSGTPASPDDLANHDLIGFRSNSKQPCLNWMFRNPASVGKPVILSGDARFRIVFDDGPAADDMAARGHGIVWAPQWLALEDLRHGRIFEVLQPWRSVSMALSIVRRAQRQVPQRVRATIDFLRVSAKSWRET